MSNLRCPYCGSFDVAIEHTYFSEDYFKCNECGMSSDYYPNQEKSPEWYNDKDCEQRYIEKFNKTHDELLMKMKENQIAKIKFLEIIAKGEIKQ